MKLHRRAEVVERRADVENLSAVLLQLFERRAADVEGALKVNVDDGAEAVGRKLLGLAEEVAGRAVDGDVYPAEALKRRRHGALDRRVVAHVRRDGQSLPARLVNLRRRGFEMFELAADERDARARFGQGTSDSTRDACSAAGDERDATLENAVREDSLCLFGHAAFKASFRVNRPS